MVEAIAMDTTQPTDSRQDEESKQTAVTLANDSATGQQLMMEADQPLHEEAPPLREETAGIEAQGPESEQFSSESTTGDGLASKNEGPSSKVGADEKQSPQMEGITLESVDSEAIQKVEGPSSEVGAGEKQSSQTEGITPEGVASEVIQKEETLTSVCESVSPDALSQVKSEQLEQAEIALVDQPTDVTAPDNGRRSSEEADEKDEHFGSGDDEPERVSEESCTEPGDAAMVAASKRGGFPHPHVSQNLARLTLTSKFTEEDLWGPEQASGMQPPEHTSQTSPTESESESERQSEDDPSTKHRKVESGSSLISDLPSPDPYLAPSTSGLGKLLESLPAPPSTAAEGPTPDAISPSQAPELGGSDLNVEMLSSSDVPKVFMCGEVLPTKQKKKSRIVPPAKLKGYGLKSKLKTTKHAVQYQAPSKKTAQSPASSKRTQTPKSTKYSPRFKVAKSDTHQDLGSTSVEVIIPPDVDYSASKIFLKKSNITRLSKKKQHSMKALRDFDYPTAYPLDSGITESSKVPLILEVLPEASGSSEKSTASEKPVKQHKIGTKRKFTTSEGPELPSSTHETTPGHLPSKAKKQKKVVPKSLDRSPAGKTNVTVSKPPSSRPHTAAPKTQGSIGRSKKGKKGTCCFYFLPGESLYMMYS